MAKNDALYKVPLSPDYVQRLVSGGRVQDFTTFFGPLNPLQPFAPPEVAGRQFDYLPGYNIVTTPGADEVDFRQLRALGDSYDLMRLVIETRKDQLAKMKWDIVRRDRAKQTDPRIAQAMNLLTYPDRDNDWATWLRMLVEDMLVLDAPAIYPRRSNDGSLYSLDPVDGATIKRIIDDYGRTPVPPKPAYQQVLKGLPATQYTRDELLYLPRNRRTHAIYGMSPVRQVLMSVNIGLRRQLHQLEFYTEGTVPDAIVSVPETWTIEQITEFQTYWDGLLADNTAERRHVRFVPAGIAKGFVQTKQDALKDEMDEWLARIVCYAFSVSAQWAAKQMNRATAESAHEQAQEEGLAPLQLWVKSMIDRILGQVMGWPDLEMIWLEEEAQDPLQQSEVLDKYLRNGGITLNEMRGDIGRDPIGPEGDIHLIYTATGVVPLSVALAPPPPPPEPNQAPGSDGPDGSAQDEGDQADQQEEALVKADFAQAMAAGDGVIAPEPMHKLRPDLYNDLMGIWNKFFSGAAARVTSALTKRDTLKKADDDAPDPADPTAPKPVAAEDAAGDALDAAIDALIEGLVTDQPWPQVQADSSAVLQQAALQGVQQVVTSPVVANAATVTEAPVADQVQTASGEVRQQAGVQQAATGPSKQAGITTRDMLNLANPRAVAAAEAQAADLVQGISETTRAKLRALVAQAENEGWSTAKLAKAIEDGDQFSKARANLIAVQELARSSIAGNLAGARAANERFNIGLQKRTILGLIDNHCPICLAAFRQGYIPLDEGFEGLGDPPFHVNCGCGLVFGVPKKMAKVDRVSEFDLMAKAWNPDQPRDAQGRWSSAALQAELEKGHRAMKQALNMQGNALHAMEVPRVGKVSFIWGHVGDVHNDHEGGYGLAKIVDKHGAAAARSIPETLIRGEAMSLDRKDLASSARIGLSYRGHQVFLSRGGNGQLHGLSPDDAWVLTGYSKG